MEQPYDMYKNEVEFDYIIDANVKVEDVTNEVISSIIQLIRDEDLLAIYFKSVALGRVYTKVEYIDDKLQFIFGISLIDAPKQPTKKDIIKEVENFIFALNKNIEDIDLGIEESDIKMDIISENCNINNLDKKLVTEGTLSFKNENNQVYMKLTDDGMVEYNVNDELIETYPFAKLKLARECRKLIQDGYVLYETVDFDKIDNTEEIKQDLEQQISDVDEIQELKNELDNKIDNLVEENVEIDLPDTFPTTEFTIKKLSIEDELDLEHNLTNEQQDWILAKLCDDILDFEKLLRDFIEVLSINTEPIISINEFIKEIKSMIKD